MVVGLGLMEALEGKRLTVSETDLVHDIHDMAERLTVFFSLMSDAPNPTQQRLAVRILPMIRPLLEGTALKYELVEP